MDTISAAFDTSLERLSRVVNTHAGNAESVLLPLLAGGTLRVNSRPGEGARIRVEICDEVETDQGPRGR